MISTVLRASLVLAFLLLPQPASAGRKTASSVPAGLFAGLTVTRTYPAVTVTHYSATPRGGQGCRLEHGNGGSDSSSSGLRPSQYRLDHPTKFYGRPTVLAAVPQRGGSAAAYGCFFALPDAHPGVLFYGGDRYGPESDGLLKTDVSSPCNSVVKVTETSRLVVYNCPGRKGGSVPPHLSDPGVFTAVPLPRPRPANLPEQADARSEAQPEPKADPKPAAGCQWFAVALCNSSEDDTVEDQRRLDLPNLTVIHTDDYSNMKAGWYCLATPAAERADAARLASSLVKRARSAYVVQGCR